MRLRTVSLSLVAVIAACFAAAAGGYLWLTHTDSGRRQVAVFAEGQVNSLLGGRGIVSIGNVAEMGSDRAVLRDVLVRDSTGRVVVRAGYLYAEIARRQLLRRVIQLHELRLDDFDISLEKGLSGPWNLAWIFLGDTVTSKQKDAPGFGDDVRVTRLSLDRGLLSVDMPWEPSEKIPDRMRDSVIALRRSLHDISDVPGGMIQHTKIGIGRSVLSDAVFVSPSGDPASLKIDTIALTISDPPVTVVQAAGSVWWTSDSLGLDLPTVQLPVSTASAKGALSFGEPGALRYDVALRAEAGLADLTWIWDVMPTDGSLSADIRMRTLDDAEDAEYSITKLKVASGASNISGKVTVTVTPLELSLSEVDLAFDPLESSLARHLSYDALPPEVRGLLRGRFVAARGGPLTDLLIDRLDARFIDANVTGAVSGLTASGRVSLGAEPAATNAVIHSAKVDLRSVAAISDAVPLGLDGVLTASGTIKRASLTAVESPEMQLDWTDGAGNTSSAALNVSAAFGSHRTWVDASIRLDPLSLPALARLDSAVNVYSSISGTIAVSGALDSLEWQTDLAALGESRVAASGEASLGEKSWSARGNGSVTMFNAADWLGRADMPATALNGTVRFAVSGATDSTGSASITGLTTTLDIRQNGTLYRPEFELFAGINLDETHLRIDSAGAKMGGVTMTASGTLARDSMGVVIESAADTVEFSFDADSIGAAHMDLRRLARMLQPVDSSISASIAALVRDSIDGVAVGSGYLYGSVPAFGATFSFGGRDLRSGNVVVGGLFGSALVTDLPENPRFETAATATDVDGLGTIRISQAEFRIGNADPARGDIVLNVASLDTSQLVVRGEYRRGTDSLTIELDTVRFDYKDVKWANRQSVIVHDTRLGQRIERLMLSSNEGGVLEASADLPADGPLTGKMHLERFPAGEIYAFAMAKKPFAGLVSGDASLSGVRSSPVFSWRLHADSLGTAGYYLPQVTSDGAYANQMLVARAMLADTIGGSLGLEARVPMNLAIGPVEQRLLSDTVDADLFATQLQLGALGVSFPGIERLFGLVDGQMHLGGTLDFPYAQGEMAVDNFSAWLTEVGIEPIEGRAELRASRDSLVLDRLRFRSGGRNDTVSASGGVRFARGETAQMRLQLHANNTLLAHLRDGTRLVGGADLLAAGPLRRPTITGRVFIPEANIIADPLGASTALDLSSPAARELLGTDEVPVAETATESFAAMGRYLNVRNARVEFGDEVWVNTPEAVVRVTGGIGLITTGETIAPEGEIQAGRGTYRLNLGVVQRSFSIDSGTVKFFGNNAIPATVDMTATNIVRSSESAQIPVRVHIGGTLEAPVLTLSSPDPLYSGAPDSEIISLLIFGAPTFALDGKSQSTVRAVAGVLVPTVGGALEGTLQRLLPFQFNTLQIQTPGGARDDLSAMSLIDNLSIVAGKQLSDKTFLRLNTGVCRGGSASAAQGVSVWAGVAVEYLLARQLTLQVGVDPGTSPCSRLSGDVMPRMQLGFDVFRDWLF